MYPIELSFIEAYLQEKLSYERLLHSKGVAKIAENLAEVYGIDPMRARIAGLSHDISREWTEDRILEYIKRNNIKTCQDLNDMPKLAHGIVGAEFLKSKLGIDDEEILEAIRSHSMGGPKMTKLQKIIFIADFCESTRKMPKSREVLEVAQQSLDKATLMTFEMILDYLKSKKMPICSEFLQNMEDFKRSISTRK